MYYFQKDKIKKMLYDKNLISLNIKLLEYCNDIEIGTKAKNLKIIKEKYKCLIPKTLIINTEVFKKLLMENNILNPLSYNWSNFQIPRGYQEVIIKKINEEFSNKPLVIRSSATCEDSPLLSFAGQYSSFLNIRGEENIIKAIKLCYQSLFSDNARIYAKLNGVNLKKESMAVIIQELIKTKIAGVIFTANPVNQNTEEVIIEYSGGFGDSIVSGNTKPIIKRIKKIEIDNVPDGFFRKLLKIALKLEMAFGSAQDIEWGCDGKEIYIFQTRNITTLNKQPKIIKYNFRYGKVIGRGISACRGISKGILRIINNNQDYDKINKGDIVFLNCKMDITLVSKIPLLNGLIINGGILSHFAVLAREFNIPCLVQPIFYDKIEDYENRKVIVDAIRGKLLLY